MSDPRKSGIIACGHVYSVILKDGSAHYVKRGTFRVHQDYGWANPEDIGDDTVSYLADPLYEAVVDQRPDSSFECYVPEYRPQRPMGFSCTVQEWDDPEYLEDESDDARPAEWLLQGPLSSILAVKS